MISFLQSLWLFLFIDCLLFVVYLYWVITVCCGIRSGCNSLRSSSRFNNSIGKAAQHPTEYKIIWISNRLHNQLKWMVVLTSSQIKLAKHYCNEQLQQTKQQLAPPTTTTTTSRANWASNRCSHFGTSSGSVLSHGQDLLAVGVGWSWQGQRLERPTWWCWSGVYVHHRSGEETSEVR